MIKNYQPTHSVLQLNPKWFKLQITDLSTGEVDYGFSSGESLLKVKREYQDAFSKSFQVKVKELPYDQIVAEIEPPWELLQ